jgi:hypothetical protein
MEVPEAIGVVPSMRASLAAVETPTALDNHPSTMNRVIRFIADVTFIQVRPQGHPVPRLRREIQTISVVQQ